MRDADRGAEQRGGDARADERDERGQRLRLGLRRPPAGETDAVALDGRGGAANSSVFDSPAWPLTSALRSPDSKLAVTTWFTSGSTKKDCDSCKRFVDVDAYSPSHGDFDAHELPGELVEQALRVLNRGGFVRILRHDAQRECGGARLMAGLLVRARRLDQRGRSR